MVRLKRYIKPYILRYITGFVSLILTNAFALCVPWLLKNAIDDLKAEITYEKLVLYPAMIVGATAIQGIFRYLSRQSMLKTSHMIQYDILNDFFGHLLILPMSFYDKRRTGDLISLATNDLKSVRMMLGIGVLNILNTIILLTFTAPLLVMIDLRLTLTALLPFPLIAIFVKRYSSVLHKAYMKVQQEFANINTRVHESVSGIRVIKTYVRGGDEIKDFNELCDGYMKKNMKVVKLWGTILPLVEALAGVGTLIVLWVGGRAVITGRLTIGEFVAFNAYLAMLFWPMIALGWVITLYQRSRVSMERLNKVFDAHSDTGAATGDDSTHPIDGDIKIDRLTFSYDEAAPPVLKDISLHIKKGEKVAIVGPTGSGKTTLLNLLARLYKVADGRIFVDDIDINKIDLHLLRRSIGFVPQDTFLFSDTIGENIAFGMEAVEVEELRKYAEVSDLLENVEEFPKNFDTYLGERGVNLSGGQKQRATISRAIIKEPKILILDDATSNVDAHTEENIIGRLKSVMKGCTIIMVSHRIATVMNFDRIIVIKDGELEDTGTHEQLIRKRGTYYKMYELHLLYQELDSKQIAVRDP